MNTFWHWFVVVVTLASLAGCLWLLFANAKAPGGTDTGHVWDDDLREYNNPLPRWWLGLFVITVVFGAGYLVVYPGLGNYAGWSQWSSADQLDGDLAALQAKRDALFARFRDQDVAVLAGSADARSLGRELFLNNCAGCHGADARGALGFPDLTDDDWLYGGSAEAIVTSIAQGRAGVMPAFNGTMDAASVEALVTTIVRWSDASLAAETRAAGMARFRTTCIACHGPEGQGNPLIGAPNLTDGVWLHGGNPEQVRHSILFGRRGSMPAHQTLLSADEIHVIAGYVYGLSQVR
ncbi:cytochrome-c oxidase, cbb3-type subunit III [Sinimarinibacterium flocculans]|uniref:cytochrome-c oxidase, cbb3-type subunit III n=1 Tax=Sinimarinibacterium flocculans TaxID=985250 RepID=UPI0035164090